MKFRVTFKDPDSLHDCIRDAVAEIDELCGKWFEYGEYLVVEVDTDAKTCVVVENNK